MTPLHTIDNRPVVTHFSADSLTLCRGRTPDCPEDLVTEMTGATQTSIEPRRKKHQGDYYPVSRHRPRTQGTHLSYG